MPDLLLINAQVITMNPPCGRANAVAVKNGRIQAVGEQEKIKALKQRHTRVMDLVWPEDGQQAQWLSAFSPVSETQPNLTADDFATVPMFRIGGG